MEILALLGVSILGGALGWAIVYGFVALGSLVMYWTER